MPAKWIPPDLDDLISRYLGGTSEKALAEIYGVSRDAIRGNLQRAGVPRRNRSAGMYARMAQTSPEERARLASAAHDAVRGVKHTTEMRHKMARSNEGLIDGRVSAAELILGDALRAFGCDIIHQKAVGPYNVDLATGSVAVEVLGGGWHRTRLHGKRLRYILDAGWDVIYIWVHGTRYPLGPSAAQDVVAHCKFRSGNPSAPRCYRVIRGDGEFVASGSADSDDIPDVLPITSGPDVRPAEVPFGFCHCGCGGTTNAARPWGEPARFISGHNNPWHRHAS